MVLGTPEAALGLKKVDDPCSKEIKNMDQVCLRPYCVLYLFTFRRGRSQENSLG